MRLRSRIAILATLTGYAVVGAAHHGPASEPLYDTGQIVEFDGVVTDPATFTAPARLTGEWMAIPGIEIQPFDMDCSDNAYL